MNIQKNKSYFQLENINFFSVTLALYAICCSMALNHGDTTLGSSTVHLIFVASKNLFLLCSLLAFFRMPKSFSITGFLLLTSIVLLDVLSGYTNTMLIYLGLILLFFCAPELKWQCYKVFYAYMVVTGAIGILCYISFALRLPVPYETVNYYGEQLAQSLGLFYADYKICYLTVGFDGIRLCGLFNEPGYYGTMAALFLISNKCDFKDKWNIILLLAGILSISLAFFILVGGYIIASNFTKIKKLIGISILVLFLIIVLTKVGVIPESTINGFLDRFTYSDGSFNGDNRSNDYLDSEFRRLFSDTAHFVWGHGNLTKFDFRGVASYKLFMIQFGVVGSILAWSLLLIASLKATKMSFQKLLFIGLFFVSIYQRYYVFDIVYILVLIGGLYNLETKETTISVASLREKSK